MKRPSSLVPLAAGLLVATGGSALAATHYVDMNSPNSTPPYTNWDIGAYENQPPTSIISYARFQQYGLVH